MRDLHDYLKGNFMPEFPFLFTAGLATASFDQRFFIALHRFL